MTCIGYSTSLTKHLLFVVMDRPPPLAKKKKQTHSSVLHTLKNNIIFHIGPVAEAAG